MKKGRAEGGGFLSGGTEVKCKRGVMAMKGGAERKGLGC